MLLTSILLIFLISHLFIEFEKVRSVLSLRSPEVNPVINGFSIVICARNEGSNLKTLISQILSQNYPDFEVILILDRCEDHSVEIARSVQDTRFRFHQIQNIPQNINPKKHGLSTGISLARNKWILLTDGDCLVPGQNWISGYNNLITEQTDIILGTGPYDRKPGLLSGFIQYETFQTALSYTSAAINKKSYMGVGRNLAYRKSRFLETGGFDRLLHINGGDDDLLVQQMATAKNTAINLQKESQTLSCPSRTWTSYFHQKTRHLAVGRYYKREIAMVLTYGMLLHFVLWLSFLILIYFSHDWRMVIAVFGCFLLLKGFIYNRTFRTINMNFNLFLLPLLDFGYGFILPLIGIRSFFVRHYIWKN